jgi:hypothetical protein
LFALYARKTATMMISVVIAPTIVGDAASDPTRARPFTGSPPYI